jgi:outer membrane protein OmpA-like peptidoglycan-associated protein
MFMQVMKFFVLSAALLLAACAANDPYQRTKTGAAVGAVAGAIIGNQINNDSGKYVGAALGAALGGGIGYAMDQQQQQLQALAAENQRLGLEVERLQDGSIRMDIPSEVLFDFDSARIKSSFMPTLNEVASILNQETRSTVQIVGHTDSTGDDGYNLRLSRERANSVADALSARGVAYNRLYTEGRGEEQPVASNATEQGRRENRRVELFIRPTS